MAGSLHRLAFLSRFFRETDGAGDPDAVIFVISEINIQNIVIIKIRILLLEIFILFKQEIHICRFISADIQPAVLPFSRINPYAG